MTSAIKPSRNPQGWDSVAVKATPSYVPRALLHIPVTLFGTLGASTIQKIRNLLMKNPLHSDLGTQPITKVEQEIILKESSLQSALKKIEKIQRENALKNEWNELGELCGKQLSENERMALQKWRSGAISSLIINLTKAPTDSMLVDLTHAIMDKAETTIQIFAQQLLQFYEFGKMLEISDTVCQIGTGKNNEKEKSKNTSCFQAAHFATITGLKYYDTQTSMEVIFTEITPAQCDHNSSKPDECIRCISKDVFKRWNSTGLFPDAVNKVDTFIDVLSSGNKLRPIALIILNRVANPQLPDSWTPANGLVHFVNSYLSQILRAQKHYKTQQFDVDHLLHTLMCYKKTAQAYKEALEQDPEDLMRKICFRAGKNEQTQKINQTLNQAFYRDVRNEIDRQNIIGREERPRTLPHLDLSPSKELSTHDFQLLLDNVFLRTPSIATYVKKAVESEAVKKLAREYFNNQMINEATRQKNLKHRIDSAQNDKELSDKFYDAILKKIKEKEQNRKSFSNRNEIILAVIQTLWQQFEKESAQSPQLPNNLPMHSSSSPSTSTIHLLTAQNTIAIIPTTSLGAAPPLQQPLLQPFSLPSAIKVSQILSNALAQTPPKPSIMTPPVASPTLLSTPQSQNNVFGSGKALIFSPVSPPPKKEKKSKAPQEYAMECIQDQRVRAVALKYLKAAQTENALVSEMQNLNDTKKIPVRMEELQKQVKDCISLPRGPYNMHLILGYILQDISLLKEASAKAS